MDKTVYTIGHSTKDLEEFIFLLKSNGIETLVDVRAFPGSRRYPQYNKDQLKLTLRENGIIYHHIPDLGGRRKPIANSINTAWRNDAFKAYSDYMSTSTFKEAAELLLEMASNSRTVYMCSEAVWWRCHRRLISDWFVIKEWKVLHILSKTKLDVHKLNEAAVFIHGDLFYPKQ